MDEHVELLNYTEKKTTYTIIIYCKLKYIFLFFTLIEKYFNYISILYGTESSCYEIFRIFWNECLLSIRLIIL